MPVPRVTLHSVCVLQAKCGSGTIQAATKFLPVPHPVLQSGYTCTLVSMELEELDATLCTTQFQSICHRMPHHKVVCVCPISVGLPVMPQPISYCHAYVKNVVYLAEEAATLSTSSFNTIFPLSFSRKQVIKIPRLALPCAVTLILGSSIIIRGSFHLWLGTMGNLCCGQSVRDKQEASWRVTGIVGVRDQGLRELPSSIEALGAAVKVLDATGNKLKEVGGNTQRGASVHAQCCMY